MGKTDATRDLLAVTMKELFPPRVELNREQHEKLQKLSQESGMSLKELVGRAIEFYLQDAEAK